MKMLALGITSLFLIAGATGCALIPTSNATMAYQWEKAFTQDTDSVQTSADRMHTQRRVVSQDARAFVDDLDYVFLTDRPSRLSRWHNR